MLILLIPFVLENMISLAVVRLVHGDSQSVLGKRENVLKEWVKRLSEQQFYKISFHEQFNIKLKFK